MFTAVPVGVTLVIPPEPSTVATVNVQSFVVDAPPKLPPSIVIVSFCA